MNILLLLASALLLGSTNGILVNTPSGPIEGTLNVVSENPVQVYLGVPYAKPPLGSLRFKKPEPIEPWTKILSATKLPPACMQYTIYPFPWYDDQPGKSEDCLYLNIYAPIYAKEGSKLAVLFWIHGGGWLFGSSRDDLYNATEMAYRGNMIVVTINYRLGVFGFLTSNTTDAPGNVGMYDMLLALQWVNNNIESFGGDKTQITLAGESAGSISASLFCASPLTKGLFSRAILQSGAAYMFTSNRLPLNMDYSQKVAETAGCSTHDKTMKNDPENVVACLRNQNATHLARIMWSLNVASTVSFWPQFGDDLFPNNIIDDISKGNIHNISLFIGNTLDEGHFLVSTGDPDIFGFFGHKDTRTNKTYAHQRMQKFFFETADPKIYTKYYLDRVTDEDSEGIRRQMGIAIGDQILVCPTVYFAESYAEWKHDVYFYEFGHRPSNTPWAPWMGSMHFEEVQFVFGKPIRKPDLYEPDEIELSKKMIEVWSNFIKKGIPSYTFKWPKYSKEKHEYVYIDTAFNGTIRHGPQMDNCNFLRSYFGLQLYISIIS